MPTVVRIEMTAVSRRIQTTAACSKLRRARLRRRRSSVGPLPVLPGRPRPFSF